MESVQRHGEIWKTDIDEPNYGYYVIAASFSFFYTASKLALMITPATCGTARSKWKWKNILVSFLHAMICSGWTTYCFYERPEMAEDLITTFTTTSHSLTSFSVGYFLYDLMDMLVNERTRNSYELIGHHVVITICFMVAVVSRHYVGYSNVALLVEVNSVFLHFRQLLQICGVSKFNPWYRLNSLINLGTFIIFRVILLSWMTRWLVINRHFVPLVFYSLGSVGLAIMVVMNITLLLRLMHSDFISAKDKETVVAKDKDKEGTSSKLE